MPTPDAHPVVIWELTRACDLGCVNCTIGATPRRSPDELTTYEAYKTIDQILSIAPREFIITGGDPLERPDLSQIVDYSRRRGLNPAVVVIPSENLTMESIARLEREGLTRLIFSLDGSTAGLHDAVHAVPGMFSATLRAIRWAETAGLSIEINTLVTRGSARDLAAIADLIRSVNVVRWNLYFLVPLLASTRHEMPGAEETERIFATIEAMQIRERFAIRLMEAPHYRRYRLQRILQSRLNAPVETVPGTGWEDFAGYQEGDPATLQTIMDSTVEGGRDLLFISHAGDVRASEFLILSAGNLRYRPLGAIFRGSDLMVALRDLENLKGRCGRCEFRHVCGGSRARAWAVDGSLFADDPLCVWQPGLIPSLPRTTISGSEASS